jgi:hypothetical protein
LHIVQTNNMPRFIGSPQFNLCAIILNRPSFRIRTSTTAAASSSRAPVGGVAATFAGGAVNRRVIELDDSVNDSSPIAPAPAPLTTIMNGHGHTHSLGTAATAAHMTPNGSVRQGQRIGGSGVAITSPIYINTASSIPTTPPAAAVTRANLSGHARGYATGEPSLPGPHQIDAALPGALP